VSKNSLSRSKGFTLLELIVTIIIIGIMSVTVLPRFFESSGYEEYTYRAQAIAVLRNIQLRSMQQNLNNSPNLCVLIDSENLGMPDNGTCAVVPGFSDDYGSDDFNRAAQLTIENSHEVTFSPMLFAFDNLGVPTGDCAGGCTINITGIEDADIVIESQGYIHAL